MSLIWHIALKDLRRLRLPLLLWAALIAGKLGVGVLLIFRSGGKFDSLVYATNSLAGLEVLAGYFLVATLLHGDVLVGSTSFWITRPISSDRLFAGKLAALAVVFGAIPLVLHLPWWLLCGYGAREVMLSGAEIVLEQGAVVALALALATLTDGLPRFIFWTLILLTMEVFAVSTFAVTPDVGALAALSVVLAGGAVCAVIHLFQRRLLVAAVLLGAVALYGLGISWAIGSADFRNGPVPAANLSGLHAAQISLALSGVDARERGDRETDLYVGLRAEGLPPEFILEGSAQHRWTWRDGATLQRTGSFYSATEDSAMSSASYALGLKRPEVSAGLRAGVNRGRSQQGMPLLLEPRAHPWEELNSFASVPAAFGNRVRRDPPAYLLRADLRLMRPVVVGETLVRAGNVVDGGGERTRLASSLREYREVRSYGSLRVALTEYRCTVPSAGEAQGGLGPFLFSGWPRRAYLLVNRRRGEAVWVSSGLNIFDASRTKPVRVGTVGIVWRELEFRAQSEFSAAEDRRGGVTDWFEGVTLAKLRLSEEESFTKDLRVDRFELTPNRPAERRTP